MALMERVATLLRANVNDLIDRAEDPEKMLKQLLLDMENQLLQVKTQVAIAIADQHLLEKKAGEQRDSASSWRRKAELAVSKGDDDLARLALERGLSYERLAESFAAQIAEQASESEALRTTYSKLGGKLAETSAQCELLIAEHRRARMVGKANSAHQTAEAAANGSVARGNPLSRFKARISTEEAENHADKQLLAGDTAAMLDVRFASLEREEKIERLLDEIKGRQARMLPTG